MTSLLSVVLTADGRTMDSFMTWVGVKKALREEVVARFPLKYERYIEVFGGAGWVLFYKQPQSFEVYNDYNSNLVNLFRCVRDNPNKLKYKLRYYLDAREDFRWLVSLHKRGLFARFRNYDRAAKFYAMVMYSYGHTLKGFNPKPYSLWSKFPLIDACAARLQTVVVENMDFQKLIELYDRPVSFFYCDPPYYSTENFYKDVDFGRNDHIRLHDALMACQGKFLISYNDCPEIRTLWADSGIMIESIERPNNLRQRYDAGCQYRELFISNYDTAERTKFQAAAYQQLPLWDIDS